MIELSGVSKTVSSGAAPLTILHPTDLAVARGDTVAVVGPSGSGKSTLLGLIAGLDAPTSGRIRDRRDRHHHPREDTLARLRGQKSGSSSSSSTSSGRSPQSRTCSCRSSWRARARRRPGHVSCSPEMGLAGPGPHYPSQLSGAESNSGWPWRGPWPTIRRCCWPTSPRATSTARRVSTSWTCLRGQPLARHHPGAPSRTTATSRPALDADRAARRAHRGARRASRDAGAPAAGHAAAGANRAMTFVLRMAVREMRASWRRCSSSSSAWPSAWGHRGDPVGWCRASRGLQREVRTLMAADAIVQTNRRGIRACGRASRRASPGRPSWPGRGDRDVHHGAAGPTPGTRACGWSNCSASTRRSRSHGRVTLADGRGVRSTRSCADRARSCGRVADAARLRVRRPTAAPASWPSPSGVSSTTSPAGGVGAFSFGSRVLVTRADLLRAACSSSAAAPGMPVMPPRGRGRPRAARARPAAELPQRVRVGALVPRRGEEIGEDLQRAETT